MAGALHGLCMLHFIIDPVGIDSAWTEEHDKMLRLSNGLLDAWGQGFPSAEPLRIRPYGDPVGFQGRT